MSRQHVHQVGGESAGCPVVAIMTVVREKSQVDAT